MTEPCSNERVKREPVCKLYIKLCLPSSVRNSNLVHLIFKFIFKCLPINIIYAHLGKPGQRNLEINTFKFPSYQMHYMHVKLFPHSPSAEQQKSNTQYSRYYCKCIAFFRSYYICKDIYNCYSVK